MKRLNLALAVTVCLVVLLTQVVVAQDASPDGTAGGPGGPIVMPPNELAVRAAAAEFDKALLAAEAAATGRSRPGAILVTPPFRCAAILGAQTSAEKLAAMFRDPWERDLAPVRSLYADLLAMAAKHGGLARLGLDSAERMDQLEQAYALGPSDQVREAIEFFDQDHHWHPAYPIMELVVPLMTVPGQGDDGGAGVDPRNLEALRTWGQHIASDLTSQVLSDGRYSLIGSIVRLGQAGGGVVGTTPEIADALADALRFRVRVDLRLTSNDLGYPTRAKATLEAPDLRLAPSSLVLASPLTVTFEGDGTITEHGGVIARGRGTKYSMETLSVPTTVTLVFDPCGKITIEASPWGDNESVTMAKGMGSLTMEYPGTGMWDSAMRTALRRSPKGLSVTVEDGEVTLPGTASLGYSEGDTSVKIKAALEVARAGDGPASGEEP
jgi:hypothetical protein